MTDDDEKEMSQGTLTDAMTDVDLTNGAVSNEGTGLKDGLKGPNKLREEDVLNGSTIETKDDPVDLTASVNRSGSNGVLNESNDDGSVSNGGTGPKKGLNESMNEVDLTGDGASKKVPKGSMVVDDIASVTTIDSLTDSPAADTTPPQIKWCWNC